MQKFCLIILFLITFFSCYSVEKHNAQLEKKIAVDELKSDIDYVYKKLINNQPDLDWFITEVNLKKKFDSVKASIHQPLKPIEFYYKLDPLLGEIKQGHNGFFAPQKKYTKKETKALSKTKGTFSQFTFQFTPNELYISKNNSDDKTIPIGQKIYKINDNSIDGLYKKYRKLEYSDGFNTTFIDQMMARKFANYYSLDHGLQDSITLEFLINDSIIKKTVYRKNIDDKPKEKIEKKDSATQPKLTKQELKINKLKNKNYGFDRESKKYAIELSYPTQDSTIAQLKVRNFTKGFPKKAYQEIFQNIEDHQVKDLILDLRNNGGGYLKDAQELYTYLQDSTMAFTQKTKVTSKTSLAKNYPRNLPFLAKIVGFPAWSSLSVSSIFNTKKAEDGNYYYKIFSSKPKAAKDNNFKGNIYVLMNGGSFSATSILISMLDQYTNAIFIGEESGGNYNGTVAGQLPVFTLPNSKLKFQLGLMSVKPNTLYNEINGHGKIPEYEVKPTKADILKDRDPILKKALNLIENNSKTSIEIN